MSSTNQQRVAQGGMFHIKKVNYSPETQAFLKELIRESKLSMFQRRKLEDSVRKGEPLPLPPNKTARGRRAKPQKEENVKFLEFPRRRTKQVIYDSGAYDVQPFIPNYEKPNHDTEKRRLQDLMAFGKTITQDKTKALAKIKAKQKVKDNVDDLLDKDQLYNETLKEIKERLDFLKFMEEKGEKKEYESMIKQEIATKLKKLETMDEGFRSDLQKEYKNITDRAAMKIFGNSNAR